MKSDDILVNHYYLVGNENDLAITFTVGTKFDTDYKVVTFPYIPDLKPTVIYYEHFIYEVPEEHITSCSSFEEFQLHYPEYLI